MVENPFNREKVIAIIQSRGITLQEFSEKSGIAISSLSAWLRGFRHPKLENIRKIAECLQCKISDISTYNNPYLEERLESARRGNVLPIAPNTINNNAELRECIKDAMMAQDIKGAEELSRRIGYDSPDLLERMLAGRLNWFPDILSAVSDALKIKHDDLPITPNERYMLAPEGIINRGAVLVRQIPVVDWVNVTDYVGSFMVSINPFKRKWDPDFTETVPVPVRCSKDTVAFLARGQSMVPKILDREILICEPVESINDLPDNKIVVVRFTDKAKNYAGEIFCKRLRRLGGVICLTSDNPAGRIFENVIPTDIAWVGRVIWKYDKDF